MLVAFKNYICLWLLLLPATVLTAQNKFALIVANSDYSTANTGWRPLNCAKDTFLIRNALLKKGFKPENIKVVYNATKAEIQAAFDKYLIKKTNTGDIAYFHFSGHGQLIKDLDGDEMGGYDQALAGIDAPSVNYKTDGYDGSVYNDAGGNVIYDGGKHLIDDDLGVMLNALRLKAGADGAVLVTIDACHANTSTKGMETGKAEQKSTIRGIFFKWNIPGEPRKYTGNYKAEPRGMGLGKNGDNRAPLFCLYASSQNEANMEYQAGKCGSLSYAFSKALTEIPANGSYQTLYYNIRKCMADSIKVSNIPQYEGNVASIILSGKLVDIPLHFFVKRVMVTDTVVQAVLDAGTFSGVEAGDRISFYACDVTDTAHTKYLCNGHVILANNTEAAVVLKGLSEKDVAGMNGAWAYNLTSHYTHVKTEIADTAVANRLAALALKSDRIRFSNSTPDLIVKKAGPTGYSLFDKNDKMFAQAADDRALFEKIELWRRYHAINNLDPDYGYKVSIDLLDGAQCSRIYTNDEYKGVQCTGGNDQGLLCSGNSPCNISAGTYINFRLVNRSGSVLYFLLFELAPDSGFSCLLPVATYQNNNTAYNFGSCNLGIRDTIYNAKLWKVTEPLGKYKLRFIVSDQPFSQDFVYKEFTAGGLDGEMLKYFGNDGKKRAANLKNTENPIATDNIFLARNIGVYDLEYTAIPGKDN